MEVNLDVFETPFLLPKVEGQMVVGPVIDESVRRFIFDEIRFVILVHVREICLRCFWVVLLFSAARPAFAFLASDREHTNLEAHT